MKLAHEPLLIIGVGGMALVQAVMQLCVAFGLHLTGQQSSAIMTLASVLLTVLGRTQVVPTSMLPPGVPQQMADIKAADKLSKP